MKIDKKTKPNQKARTASSVGSPSVGSPSVGSPSVGSPSVRVSPSVSLGISKLPLHVSVPEKVRRLRNQCERIFTLVDNTKNKITDKRIQELRENVHDILKGGFDRCVAEFREKIRSFESVCREIKSLTDGLDGIDDPSQYTEHHFTELGNMSITLNGCETGVVGKAQNLETFGKAKHWSGGSFLNPFSAQVVRHESPLRRYENHRRVDRSISPVNLTPAYQFKTHWTMPVVDKNQNLFFRKDVRVPQCQLMQFPGKTLYLKYSEDSTVFQQEYELMTVGELGTIIKWIKGNARHTVSFYNGSFKESTAALFNLLKSNENDTIGVQFIAETWNGQELLVTSEENIDVVTTARIMAEFEEKTTSRIEYFKKELPDGEMKTIILSELEEKQKLTVDLFMTIIRKEGEIDSMNQTNLVELDSTASAGGH